MRCELFACVKRERMVLLNWDEENSIQLDAMQCADASALFHV